MIQFTGTSQSWNELAASLPHAEVLQKTHYLQTWQWSLIKARTGWIPYPFIWNDESGKPVAAAMILKRPFPIKQLANKICVLYIPRGPLMNWNDIELRRMILKDLEKYAREIGAIYIKIDPDVTVGTGVPGADASEIPDGLEVCADLKMRRWTYSKEQVQFLNTILVDLSQSEDEILNRMKQKTRYNLRLAQKKGVTVRLGTKEDLPLLFQMITATSERANYGIREEDHYHFVWQNYLGTPTASINSEPVMENLIAEVYGQPVAAVSILYWGDQSMYFYGMSNGLHREKMPNYLLQWEAMRRAKALGCKVYDTYGVPDKFEEGRRLWNVYRFKDGFGGEVYRGIGAWDYTPNPIFYWSYMNVLPLIRQILGWHGPPYTNIDERYARSRKKGKIPEIE